MRLRESSLLNIFYPVVMTERQTCSSGTPADTLLGLLGNNALLEVKDFAFL